MYMQPLLKLWTCTVVLPRTFICTACWALQGSTEANEAFIVITFAEEYTR